MESTTGFDFDMERLTICFSLLRFEPAEQDSNFNRGR